MARTHPTIRKILEKKAREEFKKIKAEMISEFKNHPVTVEIMAGPNTTNTSGTLNGVSNLFAFIGFDAGSDPVQPIIDLLEKTKLTFGKDIPSKAIGGGGVSFNVSLPDAETIFMVTPMPWASGRSWAQGIERGISGFGYLLRKKGGRSGSAVQSRVNKVRGGRFRNTSYISAFINKYKKRFEKLK